MLYKFTDNAVKEFLQQYGEFKRQPIEIAEKLMSDPKNISPLIPEARTGSSQIQLNTTRTFRDRKDFGEYLVLALGDTGQIYAQENGFWLWLSFVYARQLVYGDGSNAKVGEMGRWVPSPKGQDRYRHLVRGPYNVCHQHAEDDDVKTLLLGGRSLNTAGEVYEQLYGGRADISAYAGVLKGLSKIFTQDGRLKRGVSSKDQPGTSRRIGKLLNQLKLTYYLEALTADELLDILPKEYDRWLASE